MISRRSGKALIAVVLSAGLIGSAIAQVAPAEAQNSKVAGAGPNFSSWMTDYSKANQGRISRDAYMAESGRRWDAMDKSKQGLTTDQLNTIYGYGPSAMPATKDSITDPMKPTLAKP